MSSDNAGATNPTPEQWAAIVNTQINQLQQRTEQLEAAGTTPASLTVKPPKPAYFYGKSGDKVDLWIFEIEQYFIVVGIMDPHRVPFAASFLRGAAVTWWRAHRLAVSNQSLASPTRPITKWSEFSGELMTHFKPLNAAKIARDKLHRIRQTGSVVQLTYLFNTLCADVPEMNEAEKMDKFRRACKPVIQQKLELEEPETLFDMQAMAQRIDQIYWTLKQNRGNGYNGGKDSFQAINSNRKYHNTDAMEIDLIDNQRSDEPAEINFITRRNQSPRLSTTERSRCIQNHLCFRCKKSGHMMRECPLKSKTPRKGGTSRVHQFSSRNRSGKGRAQ